MTKLVIETCGGTDVIREANRDDEWDRDDIAHFTSIEGAIIVPERTTRFYDIETCFEVKDSDIVFLVYGNYDTGDSFHRECGCIEYVDVYKTIEKAYAAVKKLNEHYKKYKTAHDYSIGEENTFSCEIIRENDSKILFGVPWTGYFERLNDIDVKSIIVSKE